PLWQRAEQREVEDRLDEPEDHPHRVAQREPHRPAEDQQRVREHAHAGTSSRSARPVRLRKTSSSVGRCTCTPASSMPASSSARNIRGSASTALGTLSRTRAPSTTPPTTSAAAAAAASSASSSSTESPDTRRLSSSGEPSATI